MATVTARRIFGAAPGLTAAGAAGVVRTGDKVASTSKTLANLAATGAGESFAGYNTPKRSPCQGWGKTEKVYLGGIWQHSVTAEKRIPKYNNVTKVDDWAGSPDPAGIAPYMRQSDSGGGGTCGGPDRTDTPWPNNGGSCPGPCGGGCNNLPGTEKCNPWFASMVDVARIPSLGTNPTGLKACEDFLDDWNCYQPVAGEYVDRSNCRKIGFKNVQAWKTWFGRHGYTSHDYNFILKDMSFELPPEGTTPCNDQPIEFEQTTPDRVKYLAESLYCDWSYSDDLGGADAGTAHVAAFVNKYSGVVTRTAGEVTGSDFGRTQAQSLLNAHRNATKDMAFAAVQAQIASDVGAGSSSETESDGNYVLCRVYDPATGNTMYTVELTIATGACTITYYGYWDKALTIFGVTGSEHYSFTNTHFSHTFNRYNVNSSVSSPDTTVVYTVSGELSNPYTSDDVNTDVRNLLNVWDLTDDKIYDWRSDEFVSVAPVVFYNSPNVGVDPTAGTELGLDGSYNVTPYTDPSADFYDGLVLGAPTENAGVPNHFDFTHRTYRGCCDADGMFADYIAGYGAWNDRTNFNDATDDAPPVTATRWSENFGVWATTRGQTVNNAGAGCGGAQSCSDFPFTSYNASTTHSTSLPCRYHPGYLPGGAWLIFGGDVLMGQKWVETKVPRPSYNYARPYGADRYMMVESTVRCVQPGSTLALITINASTAIDTADSVWICGVAGIANGVYEVTKLSDTTYSAIPVPVAPGYIYPGRCDDGIMGKLRYPAAPAFGHPVKVKNAGFSIAVVGATNASPIKITVAAALAGQFRTGDQVLISGVNGNTNANGTWTITAGATDVEFTLNSSTPNGAYTGGGLVKNLSPIMLTLAEDTFLADDDTVTVASVVGTTAANGTWLVDALSASVVRLRASSVNFPYVSGGIVTQAGTPDAAWDDNGSKGDFIYCEYQFDLRDWQERQRVNDQYAATLSCAAALPADTSDIRLAQLSHGMPRSVKNINFYQRCLPFSPCSPAALAITPNSEVFQNGNNNGFPTLQLDSRYGAMWQACFIQTQDDYLWEAPHTPCILTIDDTNDFTACVRHKDDGNCATDVCLDGIGDWYYPHPPQVEARLSPPATAPGLPSDVVPLHYLSITELNSGSPPGGIVAPPPTGVGYNSDDIYMQPKHVETPWSLYAAQVNCVCGFGRFVVQYSDDGVQCS